MKNKNNRYTAEKLSNMVNGELKGNPDTIIKGVSSALEPEDNTVVFAENEKYLKKAEEAGAELVIVNESMNSSLNIIKVANPRLAYASIASLFTERPFPEKGIHKTAVIAKDVSCSEKVFVGANAVIDEGAVLKDNVSIGPGVYIGKNVEIGEESFIYPNVVIEKGSVIGKNVIIHSGTIIGADGFGYVSNENIHHKIPQLGNVIIEDNVEIGANTTIDCGTSGSTIIGQGTKIDNLVQIGHNVEIGKNSLVVSQVGIAGSSILGDNVTVAGQAGIVDHTNIGENSVIAACSLVTKSVPANSFYSGNPAREHKKDLKTQAAVKKTPWLLKEIKRLRKEVKQMKERMDE